MKKILILSTLFTALIFGACKDEKISPVEPENYEDKLAGSWQLQRVHYDTEIPDFFGQGTGPTPISGEGNSVEGTIVLKQNPNLLTYDFSFSASLQGLPIPVNKQGEGTWTTTRDNSKLIVTEDNGQEIIFNVEVNEAKKQVYTTTITQDVFQGISLDVDLDLEFTRP